MPILVVIKWIKMVKDSYDMIAVMHEITIVETGSPYKTTLRMCTGIIVSDTAIKVGTSEKYDAIVV